MSRRYHYIGFLKPEVVRVHTGGEKRGGADE